MLRRVVDETMVAIELELPRGQHRETLLAALANLIRRRDFETLVRAPIVLPESTYFPDRWQPTLAGARRMLRRLMLYSGLAELELRLRGWSEKPAFIAGLPAQHDHGHAAAWFAGIENGICDFGLELGQLRHEESLVAALAHEVAHAYRSHHSLVITDYDLEEKLTDLTTVYLGFGVFALSASLVLETGGRSASGEQLLFERRSVGYLSPAELALLLAAQLSLRGDPEEQAAVLAALSLNHRDLVEQGLKDFGRAPEELRAALGVPDPETWPAPRALDLRPLPDDEDDDAGEPADVAAVERNAAGANTIAFRLKKNRAPLLLWLGLATGGAIGLALTAGTLAFWGLCLLGAALGYTGGAALANDECSACERRLPRGERRCHCCGAAIVGEIKGREERLEAEERYHDELRGLRGRRRSAMANIQERSRRGVRRR